PRSLTVAVRPDRPRRAATVRERVTLLGLLDRFRPATAAGSAADRGGRRPVLAALAAQPGLGPDGRRVGLNGRLVLHPADREPGPGLLPGHLHHRVEP